MDNINAMLDDKQNEKYATDSDNEYSVNTRALTKEATTYELEKFDKHELVIFNNNFSGKRSRSGTEYDVISLTKTFKNLGFEVTTYNDLTKDAIFGKLKELGKKNFTHYGCVALAILTHGSTDGMLCTEDGRYREIDVITHFTNNFTLATKPKVFIIQACRGSEASAGVPVFKPDLIDEEKDDLKPIYFTPLECDLLIFHSCYPDRTSFRHVKHGSRFIQTLCEKIDTLYSTHDLESIMTKVKNVVAIDMGNVDMQNVDMRNVLEAHSTKQMPVMTSTLIRRLYLKKRALEEPRQSTSKQRWNEETMADAAEQLTSTDDWES